MDNSLKVTLALPYGDHKADATVSLDRATALDLVHTGRARLAETDKTPAPKTSAAKSTVTN